MDAGARSAARGIRSRPAARQSRRAGRRCRRPCLSGQRRTAEPAYGQGDVPPAPGVAGDTRSGGPRPRVVLGSGAADGAGHAVSAESARRILLLGGSSEIALAILRRLALDGPISPCLLGRDRKRMAESLAELALPDGAAGAIDLLDAEDL